MNCHDAAPLISAARDGALDETQQAAFARHIAGCQACQAWQAELARTMADYRADSACVAVPDVNEEWRLLQARLRAPQRNRTRRLAPITWIGLPMAAAAAIAFAFFVGQPTPLNENSVSAENGDFARADFVDVAGREATPVVFLDKESGVLVVWAVEDKDAAASSAASQG